MSLRAPGRAGMFLPELLKTLEFHFTVGTLPVVELAVTSNIT